MKRNASAVWTGALKEGRGIISTDSGVLSDTQYSFGSRFENGKGTNPEELIAAAHSGCFSMALSHALSEAGHVPTRVHTQAIVSLAKSEGGFSIPKIELKTDAVIPGIDDATFQKIAEEAKKNCPVSKVL